MLICVAACHAIAMYWLSQGVAQQIQAQVIAITSTASTSTTTTNSNEDNHKAGIVNNRQQD